MAPPGLHPAPPRALQAPDAMAGMPVQLSALRGQPGPEALARNSPGHAGASLRSQPHPRSHRGLMQPLPGASEAPALAAVSSSLGLGAGSSGTSAFMPSPYAGSGRQGNAPPATPATEAALWQARQAARAAPRPQTLPMPTAASGYTRHDLLSQAGLGPDRPDTSTSLPKPLSSSGGRQRAVKQQTDQQSAAPSGHYDGPSENGSAAHREAPDVTRLGTMPAAGSAVRATSFKLPPSPKSPTAWADGLNPCTNLERLFLALTPILRLRAGRSPALVCPSASGTSDRAHQHTLQPWWREPHAGQAQVMSTVVLMSSHGLAVAV